jgi:hypothetical protein
MIFAESRTLAGTRTQTLWRILVEAAVVILAGAVIALVFNALRLGRLPLVARIPYQTLVPCPEPGGPVGVLDAGASEVSSPRSFLIDARPRDEFEQHHLSGAVNVPYDWLDPVPAEILVELAHSIAASGATRVVVYGDGGRPDSGEHLGKEISGRGIKNVFFIRWGFQAEPLTSGEE